MEKRPPEKSRDEVGADRTNVDSAREERENENEFISSHSVRAALVSTVLNKQ